MRGCVLPICHLNGVRDIAHTHTQKNIPTEQVIVTAPLAFAVLIAVIAQFLVGYNTSLMNAPEAVVFPGMCVCIWVCICIYVWYICVCMYKNIWRTPSSCA